MNKKLSYKDEYVERMFGQKELVIAIKDATIRKLIAKLLSELASLQTYVAYVEAQRGALHDEVLKLQAEGTEYLEAIGDLHAELDDLSDEYDVVVDELQGFRNEAPFYKDLEERNAHLEKQVVALKKELVEWRKIAFQMINENRKENENE